MTNRRSGREATTSPLGYLEVLAAATLWGSSGVFSVHLFRRGLTPESVALLRPVAGVLFLALFAALLRRDALRVNRRGLLYLGGVGGGLTALFQVAYQIAIDGVGVPTTVALLYLAPAIVVAIAGPLLGERPTAARVALAGVSVVGVWMTVLGAYGVDVELTARGVTWGALAGAAFAGYTVFGRDAARTHSPLAISLWSAAGACVILAVVLPLLGGVALPRDGETWAILLVFGLLTIAVAALLFYDALGRLEAGRASITSTFEPVVAALLATWLLGQRLTPWGWVGLGLVVTGVAGAYLLTREAPPDAPPHE